jgi:pyrroline-5-carboxylate reductase
MKVHVEFRVGVVGVGVIGAAITESLLTGPQADSIEVALSPRSADLTAHLAARFQAASVCGSNQEVVDRSDFVILAVRPEHVREACAQLSFREEQVVIGLAAGWPASALAPLVSPAGRVCQLIPLPMIRQHVGPIVLQPMVDPVVALFRGCGRVIAIEEESDVVTFSCASATMSTFFALQSRVIEWVTSQGVPLVSAKQYVEELFVGLATEMTEIPAEDLPDVVRAHETPGGLNEQVRMSLDSVGAFDEVVRQLTLMSHERLERG